MSGLPVKPERRLDLLALVAAPLSIFVQGHRFGVGNQDIIISFIRRINDPTYLVNDWMLGTAVPHPLTTGAAALLCRALPEVWVFLLFQLVTRFLLFAGVARLVRALVPGSGTIAALVAMLVVFQEPRLNVGSHYLHSATWEAGHLGMALGVWLLAALMQWIESGEEGSRIRAAAFAGWIGGLTLIGHLFVGVPIVGVGLLTALILRRPIRETATFLALACTVGAPSLVPAFQGFIEGTSSAAITSKELIALLQWRHPHHHMPWTWPRTHYAQAITIVIAAAVISALRGRRFPQVFAVCAVSACGLFWWAGMERVLEIVAYSQPFRLLSFFTAICAAWMGVAAERAITRRSMSWSAHAIGVALFKTIPLAGLFASSVELARTSDDEPEPSRYLPSTRAMLVGAAVAFGLVVLIQTVPPVAALANKVRKDHWKASLQPEEPGRAELANWVRSSTRPDAMFVTHPNMVEFRIVEERAVFLDTKNFPHRAEDFAEWSRRYRAITGEKSSDPREWAPLKKMKFGIDTSRVLEPEPDFAVFPREDFEESHKNYPNVRFRVVFYNNFYVVVQLRD
jgi:hypothetical protein